MSRPTSPGIIGRPRSINEEAVKRTFGRVGGNVSATARALGIDRRSVRTVLNGRPPDPPALREKRRARRIALLYGLTQADVRAVLENQNGRCALCQEVFGEKRVTIDHNHITGAVRGCLCSQCNVLLGLLDADDPEAFEWWISRLDAIRAYLRIDLRKVG